MKLKDLYKDVEDFYAVHGGQCYWITFNLWLKKCPQLEGLKADIRQELLLALVTFYNNYAEHDYRDRKHVSAYIWKYCYWQSMRAVNGLRYTVRPASDHIYPILKELRSPGYYGRGDPAVSTENAIKSFYAMQVVSLDALGIKHMIIAPQEKPEPDNEYLEEVLEYVKGFLSKRNEKIFKDYLYNPQTLTTCGQKYGITRERVRQIIALVAEHIKKNSVMFRKAKARLGDLYEEYKYRDSKRSTNQYIDHLVLHRTGNPGRFIHKNGINHAIMTEEDEEENND